MVFIGKTSPFSNFPIFSAGPLAGRPNPGDRLSMVPSEEKPTLLSGLFKKHSVKLVLAGCFLFWGFANANASAFKVTLNSVTTTAGGNGLVATPIPTASTNYSVFGFSLTGGGTTAGSGTLNSITFANLGYLANYNNTYYTTAYLYTSASATYVPGTTNVAGNLVGTAVASTASQYITFSTANIPVSNATATAVYYFVVLSNSLGNNSSTENFQLGYSSSTYTKTTGAAGDPIALGAAYYGPAYTFAGFQVTLSSITTTAASNGLVANPVPYGSTNYSVFGFSLTASNTAGSGTINSLTFYNIGNIAIALRYGDKDEVCSCYFLIC